MRWTERLLLACRRFVGPLQVFRPFVERRIVRRAALTTLIWRTDNFSHTTWLGHPIWQNPMDAWLLQESIVEGEVDLVIECGTNRGGSALYMASIFDLLGRGHVLTIDVDDLNDLDHPRVEFIQGSSTDDAVVEQVRQRVAALAPGHVLVLLDSDHSAAHVTRELERYVEFVPVGDYVLVQDGTIDELTIFAGDRPGPLQAIEEFLARDPRLVVDQQRSDKYLIGHSPKGWLKRVC